MSLYLRDWERGLVVEKKVAVASTELPRAIKAFDFSCWGGFFCVVIGVVGWGWKEIRGCEAQLVE